MNGEFAELYNKLEKRIAIGEERQDGKWDTHNALANERRKGSSDTLRELKKDMDISTITLSTIRDSILGLPCKEHKVIINEYKTSFDKLVNNDLKHINTKINALLFTMLAGVLVSIVILGIRVVYSIMVPGV